MKKPISLSKSRNTLSPILDDAEEEQKSWAITQQHGKTTSKPKLGARTNHHETNKPELKKGPNGIMLPILG